MYVSVLLCLCIRVNFCIFVPGVCECTVFVRISLFVYGYVRMSIFAYPIKSENQCSSMFRYV